MRFRKTLTFLILALAFALPAGAQRKNIGPSSAGPRPNAVRPYVACAAAMSALPPRAQQKPFTQEQVVSMVRDGFGDESGAKLIEQRGIDFAPSEHFCQTLKAAGASEAFLNALRAAKPPEPASTKKPINQVQVFALLASGVPSSRVTMLVQERGIDFDPTDDYLQEVRLAGGEDELISALKGAKVTKPATVDPAAEARQSEVRRHVARGAEFFQGKRYAEAEAEFRAALRLDPQNAELHDDLGRVLLNKGDSDSAIAEYREALRVNPNDDHAHVGLGVALANKGDWDGGITEVREALRLNPNNDMAHNNLGFAIRHKGDTDGAITEYREALCLNPNNDIAHNNLGRGLEAEGDRKGGLEEYRAAYELNPQNPDYRKDYECLLAPQPKRFYVFYMVSHSPAGELTIDDAAVHFESNTLQYSFVIPFADIQRVWDHVTDWGSFHRIQILLKSGKKYEFDSGSGMDSQNEQIIRLINQKMGRH